MRYWLLKTEPSTYSWADLAKTGTARWDGVRNPAAAKNLRAMAKGDLAFVYHTGDEKAVVGVAKVIGSAYPDPTAKGGPWVAIDLRAVAPLAAPVTLATIKSDAVLKNMAIVRQGRLSVSPVSEGEWRRLLTLAKTKPPSGAPS